MRTSIKRNLIILFCVILTCVVFVLTAPLWKTWIENRILDKRVHSAYSIITNKQMDKGRSFFTPLVPSRPFQRNGYRVIEFTINTNQDYNSVAICGWIGKGKWEVESFSGKEIKLIGKKSDDFIYLTVWQALIGQFDKMWEGCWRYNK